MAPSCAPSSLPSKDAGQQEAVASCMERLKPTFKHFQAKRLAFEIRDVGFTPAGSLDTLQLLVRRIFDRAVSDPQFACPCAALCFSLTPILPTFKPPGALTAAAKAKRIDFRQTLLNLCQREFESAVTSAFASAPSEPTADSQNTASSLRGSLQFLAHLYLHHLLTDRIMLSCLLMVASSGGTTSAANGQGAEQQASDALTALRVECLVKALLIAGRQLDECLAAQHRPLLDGLYDQLRAADTAAAVGGSDAAASAARLPADVQAQLIQLLDLRGSGWAGANGVAAAGNVSPAPSGAAPGVLFPKGADGVVTAAAVRPSKIAAGGAGIRASKAAAAAAAAPPSGPGTTAFAAAAASAGPAAPPAQPLRRAQGSCSSIISRPSSQNLEGLWDLSADTYNEVRGQLLAQPVMDSPATLEAMADELVESAVAASGGAGPADHLQPASPSPQPDEAPGSPSSLSDRDWAAEVQRQWDAQCRACEIYVRLCVDALQQMNAGVAPGLLAGGGGGIGGCSGSNSGGSSSSTSGSGGAATAGESGMAAEGARAGGAAGASTSAGGGAGVSPGVAVTDMGRAFRRMLLSAAQSHFERCLAALMPPAPSQPPQTPDGTAAGTSSAAAASTTCSPTAGGSPMQQQQQGRQSQQHRAWADLPVFTPDAAAALPRGRGICHLLLGLLRHGVLTPRIVLHCAAALVDGADGGGSLPCLECACILLAGAGKQAGSFKVAEAAAFESLVKRVQGLASEPEAEAEAAQQGDAASRAQRRRLVTWLSSSLRAR